MMEIKLPRTFKDLIQEVGVLNESDFTEESIENLRQTFNPLVENSIVNGRPLDTALVVTVGYSGAGKSTLLNVLFNDDSLCSTSRYRSETSDPMMVETQLLAKGLDFFFKGHLAFVDVPGSNDSNSEKEVENFAKIQKFLNGLEILKNRENLAKAVNACRAKVYPNLVLLVLNAADNRISGDNTKLEKSLELLSRTEKLVDMDNLNLIVVVTHACCDGTDEETFDSDWQELREKLKEIIMEKLQIPFVNILQVENCGKKYRLETVMGFYVLPNGVVSHYNLMEAMQQMFYENNDLTAEMLIKAYMGMSASERQNQKIEITKYKDIPSSADLQSAKEIVWQRPPSLPVVVPMYHFQRLGFGYDPVTEDVKHINLLDTNYSKNKEVKIQDSRFKVPDCVNAFVENESRFLKLSCVTKNEYEESRKLSYGLDADTKLLVSASGEGKWLRDAQKLDQHGRFTVCNEIKVATLFLQNPKQHIKNPAFVGALESLPNELTDETRFAFHKFFAEYGTHAIIKQNIGGLVQYDAILSKSLTSEKSESKLKGKLDALLKVVSTASARAQLENRTNEIQKAGVSSVFVRFEGGDAPTNVRFENVNGELFQNWASTISRSPKELHRDIKLHPHYLLLDDETRCIALKKATTSYLCGELKLQEYKNTMKSRKEWANENQNTGLKTFARRTAFALIACVSLYPPVLPVSVPLWVYWVYKKRSRNVEE